MNRLDTTQLLGSQASTAAPTGMIWGTYLAIGAACILGGGWGVSTTFNPVDQFYVSLSRLPLMLLIVDCWAILIAVLRRNAATPLRIPITTPFILGIIHAVTGFICLHLATFDVLYELIWVNDRAGYYVVRWGIGTGLILLSLVSLLLAAFETRLVRWVLLSEITSIRSVVEGAVVEAEDMELGPEHIYEAQVLLNNLGYEVAQISGELNASTIDSLTQLQEVVGLPPNGKLTAKSMIELRNLWREKEGESSPVRAVSEHAVRRAGSRIARIFRRS